MTLNDKVNALAQIKEDLKREMRFKGILVSDNDSFSTYPRKISDWGSGQKMYDEYLEGTASRYSASGTTVGARAFYNFKNLQEVDLSGVSYVGKEAFYGCNALRKVWIPSTCKLVTSTYGSFYMAKAVNSMFYTDNLSALNALNPGWNYQTTARVHTCTYEEFLKANLFIEYKDYNPNHPINPNAKIGFREGYYLFNRSAAFPYDLTDKSWSITLKTQFNSVVRDYNATVRISARPYPNGAFVTCDLGAVKMHANFEESSGMVAGYMSGSSQTNSHPWWTRIVYDSSTKVISSQYSADKASWVTIKSWNISELNTGKSPNTSPHLAVWQEYHEDCTIYLKDLEFVYDGQYVTGDPLPSWYNLIYNGSELQANDSLILNGESRYLFSPEGTAIPFNFSDLDWSFSCKVTFDELLDDSSICGIRAIPFGTNASVEVGFINSDAFVFVYKDGSLVQSEYITGLLDTSSTWHLRILYQNGKLSLQSSKDGFVFSTFDVDLSLIEDASTSESAPSFCIFNNYSTATMYCSDVSFAQDNVTLFDGLSLKNVLTDSSHNTGPVFKGTLYQTLDSDLCQLPSGEFQLWFPPSYEADIWTFPLNAVYDWSVDLKVAFNSELDASFSSLIEIKTQAEQSIYISMYSKDGHVARIYSQSGSNKSYSSLLISELGDVHFRIEYDSSIRAIRNSYSFDGINYLPFSGYDGYMSDFKYESDCYLKIKPVTTDSVSIFWKDLKVTKAGKLIFARL